MRFTTKALLILCICISFIFALPIFCEYAENAQDSIKETDDITSGAGWNVIESGLFSIYYQDGVSLNTVSRRLGKRGLFVSGVYGPNPTGVPQEKVAYRLDRLMKRVKEILDMYPRMNQMEIRIFRDREGLAVQYKSIFGENKDYKAFYAHKYRTIYTSEEDMTDSVIAHEMAHAVIDHYFGVVPPNKVTEVLASYVDMHLDD